VARMKWTPRGTDSRYSNRMTTLCSQIRQVAKMRAEFEQARNRELAKLHITFGYETPLELIHAIKKHARKPVVVASGAPKGNRSHRLSETERAALRKDVLAGATAGQISKKYKISWPAAQYHVARKGKPAVKKGPQPG